MKICDESNHPEDVPWWELFCGPKPRRSPGAGELAPLPVAPQGSHRGQKSPSAQ